MVLQRESKLGLTFGQLLSIITVLGSLVVAYVSINVRITQTEVKITELERGRDINARNIEQIRIENREDHQAISLKLDRLIENDKAK
jgi:hypothetical protein